MRVLLASTLLLLAAAAPSTQPDLKKFYYIGGWQGFRADGKRGGNGTVDLISPSWVITAGHVAKLTGEDPKRHAEITFDDGTRCRAKRVVMAKDCDVALVEIEPPVKSVKPVALLAKPLPEREEVSFTLAGHSGGLHAFPNLHAKIQSALHARHDAERDGPSPGKAGDSGGAWLLEGPRDEKILFAIIHGSGQATQVGVLHGWIDDTMTPTKEKAHWIERTK